MLFYTKTNAYEFEQQFLPYGPKSTWTGLTDIQNRRLGEGTGWLA